jgi:hypothetical protein
MVPPLPRVKRWRENAMIRPEQSHYDSPSSMQLGGLGWFQIGAHSAWAMYYLVVIAGNL